MDISRHQGIDQFGKAYRITLENDPHASGSVDRVLAETMVRLCTETADYLYKGYSLTCTRYERGTRPAAGTIRGRRRGIPRAFPG